MKKPSAIRLTLIVLAVALVAAGVLCWAGVTPFSSDPTVVPDSREAPSPWVENGTAYDRATLDLGGAKKLVLPAEATIRRGGEAGKVQLLLAKRLSFGGHPGPGNKVSIRDARKGMGCAYRREGGAVVVAICGEWDYGIEGGTRVALTAVVPDCVEVEQRKGLSEPLGEHRAWGGLALDAAGWTAIPDVPDPEPAAKKVGLSLPPPHQLLHLRDRLRPPLLAPAPEDAGGRVLDRATGAGDGVCAAESVLLHRHPLDPAGGLGEFREPVRRQRPRGRRHRPAGREEGAGADGVAVAPHRRLLHPRQRAIAGRAGVAAGEEPEGEGGAGGPVEGSASRRAW